MTRVQLKHFSPSRSAVSARLREIDHPGVRHDEWKKYKGDPHLTVDEIAWAIVDARRLAVPIPAQAAPNPDGATPFGRFVWALSLLHVGEANRNERLIAFRKRHFTSRLLQLDEVERWIEERPDISVYYARVRITQSELDSLSRADGTIELVGGPRTASLQRSPQIEYLDGGETGRQFTAPGSTLDDLRRLSEELAGTHPWQRAQATAFILTGAVPIAQVFQMTERHGTLGPRYSVEVDAWVPSELVAKECLATQRDLLGRRARLPSMRGLNLAVLDLENPGISDGALLRLYNDTHPASAFMDLAAMRQARRDTLRCMGAVPG